jgi:ATP-dependent DNA ligase
MNQPIDDLLRMHYVIPCPGNIDINPVLDTANENPGPDYWIEPGKSLVVEVAAMNIQRGKNWHSCGYDGKNAYSLRIGWLKDIRYDKPVSQASTLDLVKKLYQQGKE